MPTNVTFTDNNRMANSFVKELYIGSKWEGYGNDNDKMILDLARDSSFQPTGSLISLGLESTYNGTTGMADGFLVVNNDTSGPIKFDPKGKFQGVDCYMVVDWSAFSLPASQTDLIDGAICFWAEIDMEKATNINNSPTIKKYLYEQRMLNLAPEDVPPCHFNRQDWTSVTTGITIDVYNEVGLASAISSNSSVTVNLKADIALQGSGITNYSQGGDIKELISLNNKQVIINGEGHKVFDFSHPITGATLQSGRYVVPFNQAVTGKEAFMTPNGEMLTLSKSNIFKARGWAIVDENEKRYGLLLPPFLSYLQTKFHSDLFVCFRISYLRFMYRVTSINEGVVYFTVTDPNDHETINPDMRALSQYTDFFLVNYDDGNDCIVIKNGYLYFPTYHPSISLCDALFVIRAKGGSHVEINNILVIGGTDNSIRIDQDTDIHITNCDVTNIAAGGISNYGNLFIDSCTLHDILNCAVRTDMVRNQIPNHSPYMEVTDCIFRDIGHYGTNMAAVWNTGKAYIANNEFINTNYCAVKVGSNGTYTGKEWRRSLIEHNLIHHTPEWINKRLQLGLQDSGDIYVICNNEKAIIRFNRIINCGGLGKNNAIYLDYWAYNVQIYGNVITGTENYYDIDCRNCSIEDYDSTILSPGEHPTTNIYIGYNVCDGYVRIQENTANLLINTGCEFTNNFMLRKAIEQDNTNAITTGNTYKSVTHCKESDGIITDETGMVTTATLIKLLENCPILQENGID